MTDLDSRRPAIAGPSGDRRVPPATGDRSVRRYRRVVARRRRCAARGLRAGAAWLVGTAGTPLAFGATFGPADVRPWAALAMLLGLLLGTTTVLVAVAAATPAAFRTPLPPVRRLAWALLTTLGGSTLWLLCAFSVTHTAADTTGALVWALVGGAPFALIGAALDDGWPRWLETSAFFLTAGVLTAALLAPMAWLPY
jgi:hypothetical protein